MLLLSDYSHLDKADNIRLLIEQKFKDQSKGQSFHQINVIPLCHALHTFHVRIAQPQYQENVEQGLQKSPISFTHRDLFNQSRYLNIQRMEVNLMNISFIVGLEVVENVAEDGMTVHILKVVVFMDITEQVLAIALKVGKRLADVHTGTDCEDFCGSMGNYSSFMFSLSEVIALGCQFYVACLSLHLLVKHGHFSISLCVRAYFSNRILAAIVNEVDEIRNANDLPNCPNEDVQLDQYNNAQNHSHPQDDVQHQQALVNLAWQLGHCLNVGAALCLQSAVVNGPTRKVGNHLLKVRIQSSCNLVVEVRGKENWRRKTSHHRLRR